MAGVAAAPANAVYLGLDSSTQGLKVVAINNDLDIIYSHAVNYDKDLPHYKTDGGVHVSKDTPGVVRQPTEMFVEALEHLFDDMNGQAFSFNLVAAMSGAGQQHGSCFWKRGAEEWMAGEGSTTSDGASLSDGIGKWLAVPESPIWMDSATSTQCEQMNAAVGGPEALAKLTGSRAYERFTGPQIARMAQTQASAMGECERVSLVSSFMCSVLAGRYAGIDYSDGSGMNLLDISTKAWSKEALAAACAASGGVLDEASLSAMLGAPISPSTIVGHPWKRLQDKYGFTDKCAVVAWTGDNPSSVAGLRLSQPGDVAISLGTSDTLFGITDTPNPGVDGHIFVSPCDDSAYMTMLCFKNGSLTRERVLAELAAATDDKQSLTERFAWLEEQLLAASSPSDRMGLFVDHPEITPEFAAGDYIADATGAPLLSAHQSIADAVAAGSDPTDIARAAIEGQVLNMRLHASKLGVDRPKRILLTGGASRNKGIQQVIANVFGAPVVIAATPDTAALGAALRAKHAFMQASQADGKPLPFDQVGPAPDLPVACEPDAAMHAQYAARQPAFNGFVESVLAGKGFTA
jgi:xylulokinase